MVLDAGAVIGDGDAQGPALVPPPAGDADLDALFVSSYDASGLDGSLDLQADGSFSYTPTAGFTGSTAFTYTVADSFGGSDTAQVAIGVTSSQPTNINIAMPI